MIETLAGTSGRHLRVARRSDQRERIEMKQLLRFLAVAGATLGALVVSGTAMAAYQSPRLDILNPSERVGGGGPLTIRVSQDRADDATFRLVIYVPQGYTSS